MMHHGIFGLIAFYTLGKLECRPQVEWTLYTQAKHWNEGQLVCWALGGQLGRPDTADDKVAMDYFINNQPWKGNAGSLTLFLDIGEVSGSASSNTELRWGGDCSDALSVWQKYPYDFTSDSCAGVLPQSFKTVQKISSAACYDQTRSFICEVEVSPSCPYEAIVGKPTINSTSHTGIESNAECQQLCTDKVECRAFVYDTKCVTYADTTNPMVFEGGTDIDANQSGMTTNYKKCYLSSMVDEAVGLSSPTSFTPFPFTCGTSDPAVTVYTVFNDSVTWYQATDVCSSLNASIAVLNTTTAFEIINALLGDTGSLSYHWVGFQEMEGNPPASWVTGFPLYNVAPPNWSIISGNMTCGATHLGYGEHKLHNCDDQWPYVCQHTTGQCHFANTPASSASENYKDRGVKSMEECYAICEESRNSNTGEGKRCFAFITKSSGNTDVCLTMDFDSWEESFTTAYSWIVADSYKSLWRFTCITVAKIQQGEGITLPTVPMSTVATDTSTAFLQTTDTTYLTSLPMTTTSSLTLSPTMSPPPDETLTTSPPPTTESPPPTTASPPPTSPPQQLPTTTHTTALPMTSSAISTNPTTSEVTFATSTQKQMTSNPSTNTPNTLPPTTHTTTTLPTTSSATSTNPTTNASNILPPTTAGDLELCRCPCLNGSSPHPNPDEFIEELAALHVPAESTGAAYRKKNSILDSRPSSTGMGTVACAFLASVFGIVVCFDLITCFSSRKRDRTMYQ